MTVCMTLVKVIERIAMNRQERKEYMKKYRSRPENKEKAKEYKQKWASNPDNMQKIKEWNRASQSKVVGRKAYSDPDGQRNAWLKYKYGITLEEYNRMFDSQEGKCAICGSEEPGRNNTNFAVDHDHETEEVRGLLCHRCNMGLGYFMDDPELLLKAAKYLA